MKKFLLIEHGGPRKTFTLEKLKSKKLDLYVACTNKPDWLNRFVDDEHIIITDTYNSVRLLSDIVGYMIEKDIKFDAIGTFFEDNVTQTADIALALGLIGINPDAARRSSSNKMLMRLACKNAGIRTPKFKIISDLNILNLKKALSVIGYPAVIKPAFGGESYGVVKISKDTLLEDVISEITLNANDEKIESFKNFTGKFLIEEYLSGPVISVDGIVCKGEIMPVGLVEFIMGPEPRFTQESNYIPGRFPKQVSKEAENMAISIVKALGFDNCGFHCEMRLTEAGPVLIEIAARLPGGPLQPGYLHATGIDLTDKLIDVWLGKSVNIQKKNIKHLLQKAVFPTKNGSIDYIKGIDTLRNHPNVWDFVQICNEGDKVVTYPEVPIPFYYYALEANSLEELETLSHKLEANVEIKVI